jgi:hypothetical protein
MDNDLLNRGFAACAKGLSDFGYSGVTAQAIKVAHDQWRKGQEPQTIIDRFAFKDFDDRPEIFGTKDAQS